MWHVKAHSQTILASDINQLTLSIAFSPYDLYYSRFNMKLSAWTNRYTCI